MQTEMTYRTIANGGVLYEGHDLEKAIRTWDGATYDKAHVVPGGIEATGRRPDGIMVRDAWLLHVNADGVCYLNPSLRLA